MLEIKLKPCPFCGEEAYFDEKTELIYCVCVRCDGCGVRTQYYAQKWKAADTWNTRFPEKETPPSANE